MEKILKCFDEENFTSLEGHLQKLSPAELCSYFKTCVRKQVEETPKLLTAIFRGLPSTTTENAKRREAIYSAAIQLLQKGDTSSFTTTKLIGTLLLETRFFPPESLANLSELFIKSFKSGEYGPGKWLEGFPQILSCISTYEKVPYVDGHMTGEEYKSHAVNTICSNRWPPNMIVSLVTVFKSLTLSPDELKHVFDKILRTLQEVEYDSIPPLVYQTLVLSLKGHKRLVLEGLVNFFNEEEAKCRQINAAPRDTDVNSVEESCKQDELHRCEGTVLLHTLFAIKFDRDLGEELISILKANRCLPEKVISPFILCLSLCIASESQFQQRVFDCLRATILHFNKEKTLRKNLSWARAVVMSEHDINKIIKQTISISAKGWDHVTQGLVQFGFTLMDFYGPKATTGNSSSPNVMASSIGSEIIFDTFKENRTVRETIVKEILKRIVPTNEPLLRQYLALLMKTIKLSHHPYFECVSKIRHVLDYIIYLPVTAAFDLLKSIMPLLAANSSLRDAVIILLHKAMFSRKVEGRKIAVSGFLSCLKHFRIMGALPNSQGSQSAGMSSQFSADVHMPMQNRANEALCLEVLGMLRRAFTQQADVRVLLYQGFPAIISASPYLTDSVLDVLLTQSNLVIKPESVPPLELQKCYKIQGSEIIYLEPVPHLLGCIRHCVEIVKARVRESESEDMFESEAWNHPLLTLMDKLTAAMIDADLENFELDKVADYSLTTSVGAKNYLAATIVMGVYEVLIEYSFLKSTEYSTSMAEKVINLLERYNKLLGISKGKPGKAKVKKKNDEKVSICGLATGTLMSSRFIITTIKALFLDNLPENQEALSELRQHSDFQAYLLTIAAQKIAQIQDTGSFENEERTPEELFQYCCTMGKLFFYRFTTELVGVTNKRSSETVITQKCLEGFAAILAVVDDKFGEKMLVFLTSLLKDREHTSASQPAEVGEDSLCNVLKRVQRLIVKTLSTEEDSTKYKEVASLIKVISILVEHLSTSEIFAASQEWADQLCKEKNIDDLPTVKGLLLLLLKINAQATVHLKCLKQLAEDVYNTLGDLEGTEANNSEAVVYSLVNVETASAVVVIILEYIDKFLSNVDWIIIGLKSKFMAKDPEIINTDSRVVKEKCICSALGETTACLHQILLTSIPAGPIVESVMLRLTKLYAVLGEFTKYYLQITTTGQQMCTRFQKLVMLVQDNMTRQVYSFMAFYQQPDVQESGRAKKRKVGSSASKAMKESKMNAQAVFNIESFEANIIKLAAKTKNKKLTAKIKPSTNRDFRLDCKAIKEVLARQALNADSDDEQNHITEVDETAFPENEPEKTSQNSSAQQTKRRKLGGLNSRKGKKFLAPTTSHI